MNWFKYRLPNSTVVFSGASESLIKGLGNGFVIAPFLNPEKQILTISPDFIPDDSQCQSTHSIIPPTTSKTDYFTEIQAIQTDLDGRRGKTIAARIIKIEGKVNIHDTFNSLCSAYPDAFVFAFSSDVTGTWIGASPELLLKKEDEQISTIALAGTRPFSQNDSNRPWDEKNIDEQQMVVEFIKDCLENSCQEVKTYPTITKKAGLIEHICTPLDAICTDDSSKTLKKILCRISPTPAVCGSDRIRSLELINTYEHFNRELYGGFCGPCHINDSTEFYVILRCAKCSDSSVAIFAGGGITPLSNPYEEWNETEMKSKTIINKLKITEE